jgi:hypothetical protein
MDGADESTHRWQRSALDDRSDGGQAGGHSYVDNFHTRIGENPGHDHDSPAAAGDDIVRRTVLSPGA